MEFSSVTVKDTKLDIAYRYRYVPDAPTVLYVHGVGCSMDDFAAAYRRPELEGYSLLSFDFPGCGNSAAYPEGVQFTIDDLASVTSALAQNVHAERLVVMGHSMGGAVALRYLAQHGKHTRAFIDVDGNLTALESTFTKEIAAQTAGQLQTVGIAKLRRDFAAKPDRGSQKYADTLGRANPRTLLDYSRSLIEYSASGELLSTILELDMPCAYLYGDAYHETVPARYGEMFAQRGIRLIEISGSAHWPMHDNPGEFYRAVGDFLNALPGMNASA
jgi:pimeloyl-ACP methyl ester carboxylesterase